jgi:hypothetical protein
MQTYCERCGPGLFDEPINAASNVVFLIAAFAAWWVARRRGVLTPGVWVLIVLATSVGIGSTIWHTYATRWAMWLDIVPIILFECAFLALYARRAAGLSWGVVAALLVPFVALGFVLGGVRWLNGLPAYAPILVVMWVVGVHHYRTSRRERLLLAAAAAFFCLALFFRTIDLVVCRQFPIGTHFLWHVLNGVVVYTSMRGVILASSRGARAEG